MSAPANKAEGEGHSEPTALTIMEPVAPLEKLAEAMKAFERLKRELLVNDDWQTIGEKKYIRRSGFRKIALAFGLSDEILEQVRTDRPDGSFVWRVRVRAWAKNGRSSEGCAACDSKERDFAHLEHDVFATAHTRAKSRAISDLVAGGAVSAEEVEAEASYGQTKQGQEKQVSRFDIKNSKGAEAAKAVGTEKQGQPFSASLQELFPSDLRDLLIFEEVEDAIVVRPKNYLPTDHFNRVLAAVKGFGVSYISDGERSRFQIPKPEG